ncbi:hypothetical protein Pcinc_029092 [Petrolisthes cinctipes]|uniref:Uncharacterized protein n=1 Tax=Petrolisthes cinctipes TaxID=88211 RepID=A0AAE1F1Q6_PETCI|nr:hypothetical protein Pcinc_029092 [Petrolisthes cinctipes]
MMVFLCSGLRTDLGNTRDSPRPVLESSDGLCMAVYRQVLALLSRSLQRYKMQRNLGSGRREAPVGEGGGNDGEGDTSNDNNHANNATCRQNQQTSNNKPPTVTNTPPPPPPPSALQ